MKDGNNHVSIGLSSEQKRALTSILVLARVAASAYVDTQPKHFSWDDLENFDAKFATFGVDENGEACIIVTFTDGGSSEADRWLRDRLSCLLEKDGIKARLQDMNVVCITEK